MMIGPIRRIGLIGQIKEKITPKAKKFLGGYAEGVTPVPIPNTEVKPLWANGTARAAVWESRSPPGIYSKALLLNRDAGLCFSGLNSEVQFAILPVLCVHRISCPVTLLSLDG
jgi:hypothetical protein